MKLVFFLPSFKNKGGVERATISLLNKLSKRKEILVILLVLSGSKIDSGFIINKNVQFHSLAITNYKRQFFKLLQNLRSFCISNDVDQIIAVETMSLIFILPCFSLLLNKPKLIVWEHFNFHNDNGKILRKYLRRLAAKKSHSIITLTNRDKNTWLNSMNIKANIDYIYNISPFQNEKTAYNIDSKTVLAVGRLVPVKGFDRLISIWSKLSKEYDMMGWHLKIVGGGPLFNELKEQIKQLNLENLISLISSTNDIRSFYQDASFLCMTSHFEGLPMVLIEAQSFGLPTIAYDCYTGPSEIIDNETGFLVENNNENMFIESIYKLIINPSLRIEMSEHSKKASLRFDENIIADKWIDLLNN